MVVSRIKNTFCDKMVTTFKRQQQNLIDMRFEVFREGNVATNGRQ